MSKSTGNISSSLGYVELSFDVPDRRIKKIEVSSIWRVNGLNCCDEIVGAKYLITYPEKLKLKGNVESQLKYTTDQTEDNALKVLKKRMLLL